MTDTPTLVEIVQPKEGAVVDVRVSIVLTNGMVGQRTWHFDPNVTIQEMLKCMGIGGPVQFLFAVPIGGEYEKQIEAMKELPETAFAASSTDPHQVVQAMIADEENRKMLERCFAKGVFGQ